MWDGVWRFVVRDPPAKSKTRSRSERERGVEVGWGLCKREREGERGEKKKKKIVRSTVLFKQLLYKRVFRRDPIRLLDRHKLKPKGIRFMSRRQTNRITNQTVLFFGTVVTGSSLICFYLTPPLSLYSTTRVLRSLWTGSKELPCLGLRFVKGWGVQRQVDIDHFLFENRLPRAYACIYVYDFPLSDRLPHLNL